MMLNREAVENVAKLARLKLSEAEIVEMGRVLSAVLENFEQIAAIGSANVEPLVTPTEISNCLREDAVEKTIDSDAILASAPEKSGRLFKVPPVV